MSQFGGTAPFENALLHRLMLDNPWGQNEKHSTPPSNHRNQNDDDSTLPRHLHATPPLPLQTERNALMASLIATGLWTQPPSLLTRGRFLIRRAFPRNRVGTIPRLRPLKGDRSATYRHPRTKHSTVPRIALYRHPSQPLTWLAAPLPHPTYLGPHYLKPSPDWLKFRQPLVNLALPWRDPHITMTFPPNITSNPS